MLCRGRRAGDPGAGLLRLARHFCLGFLLSFFLRREGRCGSQTGHQGGQNKSKTYRLRHASSVKGVHAAMARTRCRLSTAEVRKSSSGPWIFVDSGLYEQSCGIHQTSACQSLIQCVAVWTELDASQAIHLGHQ